MDYYNVIVKTDFAFKVYVDFELALEDAGGQIAKFSLRKGEHHFRVESGNPLVYFEDTLSVEYDRIIQLSFKDLIQNVPPSTEDSLWIRPQIDYEGSGMCGLMDIISGNWILAPRYKDGQLAELYESKTQAKFLIVENETFIFLSNSGRVLEKKDYHHIDFKRNDYIIASSTASEEKCGLIYVGAGFFKEITRQEYDEIIIDSFMDIGGRSNLVINVRKGELWGCIDDLGEIVLPLVYEEQIVFEYEDNNSNPYALSWNEEVGSLQLINSNYLTISIPDYQYYHKRYDGPEKQILQNNLMLFSDNNKFGLFNIRTKETVINSKYEYIDLWHKNKNLRYLRIKDNGKWGYINTEGKEVIPPVYDNSTNYYGEYAIVCRNREWWVIDEFGNRVSESICGDSMMTFSSYDKNVQEIEYYESLSREEEVMAGKSPSKMPEHPWDQMFIIKDEILKTVGLINLKNAAVVKSQFSSIHYFKAGYFIASEPTTPAWRRCINDSGHDLFPGFQICDINEKKGTFLVSQRHPIAFEACEMDLWGKKIAYKIADSQPLESHDGFEFISKCRIMDLEGRNTSPNVFDDVEEFRGDYAIAKKIFYSSPSPDCPLWVELKGLINTYGNVIIPIKNLEIERLRYNLFRVKDLDGVQSIYWVQHNRCLKVDFDSIEEVFYDKSFFPSADSKSDLLKVHYPDGYNLVDENAIPVFPIHYDSISYICPHRYAVKKNNKHGVLSETGETIIPLQYDSLCFKSENWIEVTRDGKMGVIDIKGTLVIPLRYESIENEGYNPYSKQIGGVFDDRFVFINRDNTESDFPGIEPPDSWCSLFNGKAIYYRKDGDLFLKVRGRDAIKISVGEGLTDPCCFFFADYGHGDRLSKEEIENDSLVKYVKELMLTR